MRLSHAFMALSAWLSAAETVAAQTGASCPMIVIDGVVQEPATGPGSPFGVTSYQCASCGIKTEQGSRTEYTFNAEPVVLQVESWSPLRVGDVIEAVSGHPITTRAGADAFTYPSTREATLSIRRGSSRIQVDAVSIPACGRMLDESRIERVSVLRGPAAILQYGPGAADGAIVITMGHEPRPRPARDTARRVRPEPVPGEPADESPTAGRYGFAVSCLPSCMRIRASDGTEYWKFDGYPPIAGIRPGGAAAMAGLGVGDVVVEIDGISILTEEGALRFQRAERRESLQVTILRRGTRIGALLKPR